MITNRSSPRPRRSDGHINALLAYPHHTRAAMLAVTNPRVDSVTFANWLRRGFLDLKTQIGMGDAVEMRHIADALEANNALDATPAEGMHRRYTGGDVLKVMALTALSQAGLPFKHATRLNEFVLKRASLLMQLNEEPSDFGVILTIRGLQDCTVEQLASVDGEWFAFIHVDKIIRRFLEAFDK